MKTNRRRFLQWSAAAGVAAGASACSDAKVDAQSDSAVHPSIKALKPMTDGIVPIDFAWVCPGFEEARARELIKFGDDIRTWQEDESPYRAIAQIFKDRGIATGRIGVEERMRFFIMNGVKTEARKIPTSRSASASTPPSRTAASRPSA